ncbi:UDP-GlcNAc:betaGal beta-1,3-N-acetylglucosaminyltransferase-like protein 1 isoform X1 [Amphibalanus amphitrite]|uniref:UDP-GlcNAc:betaGal beta-1,3-N-acetylglucosaminyltransferase-like protein 1 isoform X1 n=1 Tax=Amphibalanus amphitrite TaxID=1232801 RepID=UPI001C8FC701|nr:UDP-GlcNAc:betaGal beta-1,3-N-acetylglucosaminyltransferase-like protein 1 isoform X1 [Amphibalanus amphitrite]
MDQDMDISIIIPVHNAERWLAACLQSVADQDQDPRLRVEVSVYLDGSTDQSAAILEHFSCQLRQKGYTVVVSSGSPAHGVGYAKNRAVAQSSGRFLCFLDADDVMRPCRLRCQHEEAAKFPDAIVGGRFVRDPADSTERYTRWANQLSPRQLTQQVVTSHGPTVIMPTWFCSRAVFDRVDGFDESGRGTPEDLIFFYRHLDLGGTVRRVPDEVLVYRYHPDAATFTIHEDTIWALRLERLCRHWLVDWTAGFTIWNAGKQGRKLYRSLPDELRDRVLAFCDVDERKLRQGVYIYENSELRPKPRVPIVHFSKAQKPFVICVKMDLTGGQFEKNLASLGLEEAKDYVMFS